MGLSVGFLSCAIGLYFWYISGFVVVPYFLDYCGFVVYFEVGSLIPSALFFFLKIVLSV